MKRSSAVVIVAALTMLAFAAGGVSGAGALSPSVSKRYGPGAVKGWVFTAVDAPPGFTAPASTRQTLTQAWDYGSSLRAQTSVVKARWRADGFQGAFYSYMHFSADPQDQRAWPPGLRGVYSQVAVFRDKAGARDALRAERNFKQTAEGDGFLPAPSDLGQGAIGLIGLTADNPPIQFDTFMWLQNNVVLFVQASGKQNTFTLVEAQDWALKLKTKIK